MGRRKANGRHIMFSVRLSEEEHEDLMSFLSLSMSLSEDKSDQFRDMLAELRGKLKRNFINNLVYVDPAQKRIKEKAKVQHEERERDKIEEITRKLYASRWK